MNIIKRIIFKDDGGRECVVILFEDGSAAITGAENYIIEESEAALDTAKSILKELDYLEIEEKKALRQNSGNQPKK